MTRTVRNRADACPGTLATHAAADGPLARIRVPGGRLTTPQVRALGQCAAELGDGRLHLTSRANIQLRGLSDPDELARRLADVGLLPSSSHERVRNILASPLSGISGGFVDVRLMVNTLDEAIRAEPRLAELPGRFQFGLDDGRGDLPGDALDVGWRALDDQAGALLLAGSDTGLRVPPHRAVPAMVTAALTFLDQRADAGSGAWHVRELGGTTHLAAAVTETLADDVGWIDPKRFGSSEPAPVGVHPHDTGHARAIVAGVSLGTLDAAQVELLAEIAPHIVVFTPWRSAVLPGLSATLADKAAEELTAAGFLLDPTDASLGVTACIGSPGCAASAADVRADVRRFLPVLPPGSAVHVSGCERRCGRPRSDHVDAVATGSGYTVDGDPVPLDALASTVAKAAWTTPEPPGPGTRARRE
ncbi:precorrin-3B synthase [Phytoactinopolyspora mesophila]|uniref:Precorrin-3B synthase n=1 Tax=Phytoactinopolyspora mesophila TaxID=2650750 RepID=A0A7K3MAJ8_9ACTN|nr:precorrin-3B synthase [Phytoactinopolyspora mesophila]NDL60313.1 precorrin-3B synthase [Phytoactinopolyspora mesophila]